MAGLKWQAVERPGMHVRFWVRARITIETKVPVGTSISLNRRAHLWQRKSS